MTKQETVQEQTAPEAQAEVSDEEVDKILYRTGAALLATGPKMFTLLNDLDLETRIFATDAIRIFTNGTMPDDVFALFVVDPLGVGDSILSDPVVVALFFMLSRAAQEELSDDGGIEGLNNTVEELLEKNKD